jgi:hypothetical protein
VIIIIVIAMIGIMGVVGLVVDGGNVLLDRRKAQNAADSAALAGAIVRVRNVGEDWVAASVASAAENGYNNDGVSNKIEIYSPPKEGPHKDDVEYMQVIITSHVKTYFARVVGRSEITNVASAVAHTKPAVMKPLLGEAAIVSLAPTSGCNKEIAFRVYQEATFEVSGGNVFINSNNQTCALLQEAGGSIYMRYNDPITVVGGVSIQNPRRISPVISVGASPINYPPPFFMPDVTCKKQAVIKEDGTTMSPGSWGSKFPPENVTNLESGVYCLEHGFTAGKNTNLSGKGVVIKVSKGNFETKGASTLQLSAPEEGNLAGLLIYVPMDNGGKVELNLSSASKFTGTILAPASNILVKENKSKYGFHSQIIGYRISLSGDSNVIVVYNPDENYHALTMPELQLSE